MSTRAHARLATAVDTRPGAVRRTRLRVLRSDWPLMLRSTRADTPRVLQEWLACHATPARVHLTAAGAGPVGGDQLHLQVTVGAGSSLLLGEVSPTLLLPGPHGERSCTRVDITVEPGATLAWLPQLVIAAHGCRHHTSIRATVAPDARLLLREEVLFGRHGERPGDLRQRLRVVLGDRPLYDQELAAGPDAPAWAGPAVTGGHRSAGTVLLVDPGLSGHRESGDSGSDTAVMPLAGPAAVASALAPDTRTLRAHLDAALPTLLAPHAKPRSPIR